MTTGSSSTDWGRGGVCGDGTPAAVVAAVTLAAPLDEEGRLPPDRVCLPDVGLSAAVMASVSDSTTDRRGGRDDGVGSDVEDRSGGADESETRLGGSVSTVTEAGAMPAARVSPLGTG